MPEEEEAGKPEDAEREEATPEEEESAKVEEPEAAESESDDENEADALGEASGGPDIPASIAAAAEVKTQAEVWPPDGEVSKDEKTFAMLAWLLGVFTWFFAPLVIYLIKKDDSKFVAFHALQALAYAAVLVPVFVLMAVIAFILSFLVCVGPILAFLVFLGAAAVSIIWCIKANNGEWADLPLIGNWVKGIVNKAE